MTEVIYLLTTLLTAFVVDEVLGDMHIFIFASFGVLIYLLTMQI